jgi:hypothetical protein
MQGAGRPPVSPLARAQASVGVCPPKTSDRRALGEKTAHAALEFRPQQGTVRAAMRRAARAGALFSSLVQLPSLLHLLRLQPAEREDQECAKT